MKVQFSNANFNRKTMLYLPTPPNSTRLKSFWIVISVIVGVMLGCSFQGNIFVSWVLVGGGVTIGLVVPVLIRPDIASIPYRAWNKLARVFGWAATQLLVLICFAIMCIGSGKKHSTFRLMNESEPQSMWISKEWDVRTDFLDQKGQKMGKFPKGFSVSHYWNWAVHTGNWWLGLFIPFMLLISLFSQEEKGAATVPDNVYTLY